MVASEAVDVVDEADRVIGQATRAEIRARNLRHRAAYIFVFHPRGQLFVHQRTTTKDVYPGYFDVAVGGVVGAGETYRAAARRELAEELGIQVPLQRELAFSYTDDTTQVNGVVYSCSSPGPLELQREEIIAGEWVELEEVAHRARSERFCPDGLEALRRYRERLAAR